MKTLFRRTALALLIGFLFNVAPAQETPTQALITTATGSSRVTLPNGSAVPATPGLALPQGATITTGIDAQVSLQIHEGIVAVVGGGSRVELETLNLGSGGMRNALLHLTAGKVASALDPARKNVNHYRIRTAAGTARAQGTTMTVSIHENVYTVSVLVGNVTVEWPGGLVVSIVGQTLSDVTSHSSGQTRTESLGAALAAAGNPGLTEALTAAAAAVATVATNSNQITAVLDAIAAAAGHSPTAGATVAAATAAATGAAVTNATLVAAAGGTTALASAISTAAVTAATAADNGAAATLIVTAAVTAVANTLDGTDVSVVASALTLACNAVSGTTPVDAGQVAAGVTVKSHPSTTLPGTSPTATAETPETTPPTRFDAPTRSTSS